MTKVQYITFTYFTYFTYFTTHYNTNPTPRTTPTRRYKTKTRANPKLITDAHAAHCAIYARTTVGRDGAAVGAEPPDNTITHPA